MAHELTEKANDYEQLEPMVEAIETNTGQRAGTLLADSGYLSESNLKALERRGQRALIAVRHRPPGAGARAVSRTVFSVAFTVRFVTFSVVMGDGKGAWFPCRNELMPRKPATIIQKTAPGPPTPTCIWRRRGVAPGPGSSFGGGIPHH